MRISDWSSDVCSSDLVWRAARGGSRSEQITHGPANVKDFQLMGTSTHQTLVYRTGATREAIEQAEQAEYDQGVRFDNTINAGKNRFRSVSIEGRLASPRTHRAVSLRWNKQDRKSTRLNPRHQWASRLPFSA